VAWGGVCAYARARLGPRSARVASGAQAQGALGWASGSPGAVALVPSSASGGSAVARVGEGSDGVVGRRGAHGAGAGRVARPRLLARRGGAGSVVHGGLACSREAGRRREGRGGG
jgi:hypothetical protein